MRRSNLRSVLGEDRCEWTLRGRTRLAGGRELANGAVGKCQYTQESKSKAST